MAKHKLIVWPFAGFPPSKVITFRCEKCLKVVDIPRPMLENILTSRSLVLNHLDFSKWAICKVGKANAR